MRRLDLRQPEGVLALHASAASTAQGVLLFLGPGGVGKSTMCELLAERFPKVADDAVYLIRQEEGTWRVADGSQLVFGGPLREEELAGMRGEPLRAIVRLFQETPARLMPVTQRQACRHLTDAAFEIGWQKRNHLNTVRRIFATVAQVARSYPGWELHTGRDRGTADLVLRAFS